MGPSKFVHISYTIVIHYPWLLDPQIPMLDPQIPMLDPQIPMLDPQIPMFHVLVIESPGFTIVLH